MSVEQSIKKDMEEIIKKQLDIKFADIKNDINNLYTQLESLSWLQELTNLKTALPALRGWPVSPDFLLKLHSWIIEHKPKVVVELGSGATTIIIAEALRQNGYGKLYSLEHLEKYKNITNNFLMKECLSSWVEFRFGGLSVWNKDHMISPEDNNKAKWYSSDLSGINNIDLMVVDGPPKSTCSYARYPAIPAFLGSFSEGAEIWMDDAARKEEKDICMEWVKKYNLNYEYESLEKGVYILRF